MRIPLQISDYMMKTLHFSAEEHGAYMLLMCSYWYTGEPIPKDRLGKIARLSRRRWLAVEETLKAFFVDDGQTWSLRDTEEEFASPVAHSDNSSNAERQRRYRKRTKGNATVTHTVTDVTPDRNATRVRDYNYLNIFNNNINTKTDPMGLDLKNTKNNKTHMSHSEQNPRNEKSQAAGENIILRHEEKSSVPAQPAEQKSAAWTPPWAGSWPEDYKTEPEDSEPEQAGHVRQQYPAEFESLWSEYPHREGSNPKKTAFSCWKARKREGVNHSVMLSGVKRYARYCRIRHYTGTEFVMQAVRFLGSGREFESDWKANPAANTLSHINRVSEPDTEIPFGFRG